jgi:YbbR domain-containing protein
MAYHPFHHLGLKLLSIALAVLLWLIVGDQRLVERTARVPLEFQNVPPGLEIVGNPPESVEMRLRGPSAALGRILPGEIVAVLDLAEARTGTRLFNIRSREVRAPYGVRVAQVVPSSVSLTFERSATKVVPIVPALSGDPAPGHNVGRILADPAVVTVVGPGSRLEALKSATTEPVQIARATSTVVDRVTVGVADELLHLREPVSAKVTVEIMPSAEERRIPRVSVNLKHAAKGRAASLNPTFVDVIVRGARPALEDLSLQAWVDAANLAAGRYQLPVRIDPLVNVEVTKIEPPNVEVRIR